MLEPLERLTRAAWTRSAKIMVSVSWGGFLLATAKRATVGLIGISSPRKKVMISKHCPLMHHSEKG